MDENSDNLCDLCGYEASAPVTPVGPDETTEPAQPVDPEGTAAPGTDPVEPITDEAGTTAPAGETKEFTLGDVDMDGKIKAIDARIALRASARLEQLTDIQLVLADIDENGKLKAGDARSILRIAARLDPKPVKVVYVTE